MFLLSIGRIFKFAAQSFWRNIWLSLVTITIIILAFISINFLILLDYIMTTAVQNVQNKIDISIYFNPDTAEDKVLEVKNFVSSFPQTEAVKYVSQTEALENFRKIHQNDTNIIKSLEELDSNPLPPSLIVKAKKIGDYEEIISLLNNSKYAKELSYDKNFESHQDSIKAIDSISKKINTVGIIVTLIFVIIAALIVFNTIGVAIYTHREEIVIMKLVGAHSAFVAAPFIIEAIFYALFACLFSILILFSILNLVQPHTASFFEDANINLINYFWQNFIQIFGFELIAIIILNSFASIIAIRKYLKA